MTKHRFRIYLAEDNPQYRELLQSRLSKEQVEVIGFAHPNQLIQALDQKPDIVILDYFFGNQAIGLEAVEVVKTYNPAIHVIVVSGQQRVEIAIKALQKGADDYLEKSGTEIEALQASVDQVIARAKQASEQKPGILRWMRNVGRDFFGKAALSLVFALCLLSSCTLGQPAMQHTNKKRVQIPPMLTRYTPHKIQTDDKISLSIWNNEDMSVGSIFGIYNSNEVYGKWILVDDSGQVALPLLGKIKLGGMTITEAVSELETAYGKEIREPVIVVRVLNREVTITGEVNEPGNYILDKEKYTLAEVLGKAKGLTDYAKLKKVTLTRQYRRKTFQFQLDLRKMSESDLSRIYVRRGDVIHIPEKAGKHLERKMPLLIPLASLATSIGVLISVTRKPN